MGWEYGRLSKSDVRALRVEWFLGWEIGGV